MEPVNPYNERGLIRQHEKFFGRGRELREVFSNLRNMQSVSIIGQRRIGKSSFLYRIAHPQAAELNGSFDLYYLDLQRIFSVEAFYERACDLLGREDGASPLDLEEAIENRQVIFCLDEFEQAYKENFGSQFFNALRSLAQTGNLALVVATQEPLDELHRLYLCDEDVTSKFHNIFARLELGEFTPAEAREMVETPRNGSRFNDGEVSLILDLGKTHPHWLNLASALVYEAKQNGRIDRQEIERRFNEERGTYPPATSTETKAAESKSAQSQQASVDASAASRADRAIRASVVLSLLAGAFSGFLTKDVNSVGLILSGGLVIAAFVLLIVTRMIWPEETRRGER